MKSKYIARRRFFCRLLPVLAATFALLTTTGCGGSGSWFSTENQTPEWRASHRTLDAKVAKLKMQMSVEKTLAERAAFWRTISALLLVVICIALVGGAAIGSRARRDNRLFRNVAETSTDEPDTDEIAL